MGPIVCVIIGKTALSDVATLSCQSNPSMKFFPSHLRNFSRRNSGGGEELNILDWEIDAPFQSYEVRRQLASQIFFCRGWECGLRHKWVQGGELIGKREEERPRGWCQRGGRKRPSREWRVGEGKICYVGNGDGISCVVVKI